MQASLAKILAAPETKQALAKVRALDFTGKFSALPMRYDLTTSSWKMSQQSLLEMTDGCSEQSLATLPRGALMRSGVVYQLPKLALPTSATGGGSWPTPRTSDTQAGRILDEKGRRVNKAGTMVYGANLSDVVQMWPTPQARDYKGSSGRSMKGQECDLPTSVKMWPTPRASEYKGVGPIGSKSHKHRLEKGYLDATVQDAEMATGRLNPRWVAWLMMFPITWFDGVKLKRKSGASRTKQKTEPTS
jgi:hypothetical protein